MLAPLCGRSSHKCSRGAPSRRHDDATSRHPNGAPSRYLKRLQYVACVQTEGRTNCPEEAGELGHRTPQKNHSSERILLKKILPRRFNKNKASSFDKSTCPHVDTSRCGRVDKSTRRQIDGSKRPRVDPTTGGHTESL